MAARTATPSTDKRAARSGNPARRAPRTKPKGSTGPSRAAELRRLKISPEVGWYLESRGVPLPDCPPLIKTPEPRRMTAARFDPERVDKVLAVFRTLRHTQGRWAGKPLAPDPWQIAYILAPVFGWVRWDRDAGDYVRIIRDLYVDIPRKNGKSTLSAGIAVYMCGADGEQGAQVVTAATTKQQAKFVFTPIKVMVERAPALKGRMQAFSEQVLHPKSGSYIQVVSSVADAQHGANIHCSIVDELHVHKSPDLVDTLETGRGSRTQPLSVIITTPDSGQQGTIYDRKRRYIEKLARSTIKDANVYGVVWGSVASDDPFSEETHRKANPGYGISPTAAYLRAEAKRAENSPAELAHFLRLHLGQRTKQETKYIELPVWDRNSSMIIEERLRGRTGYGGLDLASTSDLCSLCWIVPDLERGGVDVVWRHWMPERAFDRLNDRTAGEAEVWRRAGVLTVTPGDVADYDYIRQRINQDREWLAVSSIGYDRWNASQLVNDLVEDDAPMVQIGQGFASMSAPLKAIKHLLLQGTVDQPMFRHGGNPLMRWQADNLAVEMDAAGNVKPSKVKSGDKIDGWSAAVDAMAMELAAEPETESAYEDRGLEVV